MRWILDIIAVLTLAGLVAAVVAFQRVRSEREQHVARTITELRRLEREIKYRAVTGNALNTKVNEVGWPVTVEPSWFENPPVNMLVSPDRPWLEVAPADDAHLLHPRVRVTIDEKQAGWWYNPYQGIVRARVPVMVSDTDAAELYNRLNGSSLTSIFESEPAKRAEAGEESGATAGTVTPSRTTTGRGSKKPARRTAAAPR